MTFDPFKQLLQADGVNITPLLDGSRLVVINEPEKVLGSLSAWMITAFNEMKVLAAERYLREMQESCAMMDMRHQHPPGVLFHFEGQSEMAESGTQIMFASGGGIAEALLAFSILAHLVPGEEPIRLMSTYMSGTAKTRQRIMKKVNQLIAQHQDVIETHTP